MSDSVGQYLNEIGMVPLLNAAEERELSQIIEKGQEALARKEAGERGREINRAIRDAAAAKDRFIRANLRLVVSVARRYPLPSGMELLDLVQEGNLGLEHAVDKFDWRKGFKFSTYATFWIRQAIGRAHRTRRQVSCGFRATTPRACGPSSCARSSGDGDELDEEHARSASAHHADVARIAPSVTTTATSWSTCFPTPTPGPEQLSASTGPSEEMVTVSLLGILDDRARYAVEQRFGLHDGRKRSYREVGEELGVTAEAARRLVKRAVNTVREHAPALADIDAA